MLGVAKGTVGKLSEIIITLTYILEELQSGMYMILTRRPLVFSGDQFRTDAKCADGHIVVGGWELGSRCWFAVGLLPGDVPFLFKPGGESQWASTSAELLASLFALEAFGWLKQLVHRKALTLSIAGGPDNRANEALTIKREPRIGHLSRKRAMLAGVSSCFSKENMPGAGLAHSLILSDLSPPPWRLVTLRSWVSRRCGVVVLPMAFRPDADS